MAESSKDFVVTPWEVSGKVDYDKLVEQFGTQKITDPMLKRMEKVAGELHFMLRRKIFFSHRDFDWILNRYEAGERFFLYTGRGPSGHTHLGHMVPWIFTAWLQKKFGAELYFQMTDDEKYLIKDLTTDQTTNFAYENALDVLACGMDPKKTHIFTNLEYGKTIYKQAVEIAKHVTFSTAKAVFGFENSSNIGIVFFPAVQAVPCFLPSVQAGRNIPCLIPAAIDQDSYWRIARDIAPKMGFYKPAQIHNKFIPGLGSGGKMSASDPSSAIFTTDTPEQIEKKIMNAFSVDSSEPLLIKDKEGIVMVKIGDFVDGIIETQRQNKCVEVIPEINGEASLPNGAYEVASFNENFKIEFRPVEKVIRHKYFGGLFELELESGYKVKVTGSHSVFVLENGEIKAKKVEELGEDDYVVVPKKIPENENCLTKLDLLQGLSKLPDELKSKIYLEAGNKKRKLIDLNHEDIEKAPDNAELKYYKSKLSFPVKINIEKDFLRFLGYYAAEGTCRKDRVLLSFGEHERETIEDASKIIKKTFNLNVKSQKHCYKGKISSVQLEFGGKLLTIIIEYVLKAGKNAHGKKIPALVFNVDKDLQKEFLKGYFGDGSLDKRAIIFKTVSQDLASDLKYLFVMNNAIATVDTFHTKRRTFGKYKIRDSEGFRVILCGKPNINNFSKIVPNIDKMSDFLSSPEHHAVSPIAIPKNHSGFEKFYRLFLRGSYAQSYCGQKHISPNSLLKELENIKKLNKPVLEHNKDLNKKFIFLTRIANGDLGFARIKNIKKVKTTSSYVYDISVKNLENFVGGFGGIVLHNTGQQPTKELQRKLGGNPDVCSVCQYYYFLFEQDDRKLAEIFEGERSGTLLAGEHKADLAERVKRFIAEHQRKREKARKVLDKVMLKD